MATTACGIIFKHVKTMKQKLFTSKICALAKASARKIFALSVTMCLLFAMGAPVFAQTETLGTGSYIINMGVVPQTQSNALKPYGLVYDLLKNHGVHIKWVISATKVKDGPDFTYNGVQYKGGTFIIPAEFRTAAVNGRITFFGVTGTTTTSPLAVDVTYTLKIAPRWTLDVQNGNIATGFFVAAGIPASSYNSKTPAQLNGCDDIYVMPHADADWSYYGPLRNWVLNNRGSFWGGCRTGSQIENLFNPAIPSEQMNFLSNNVGAAGNALLPHGNHKDGTPPYIHQFPSSPVAQYMGVTDGAHQGGSEQIYLPVLNGSWRATTQVISYDPTQEDVPVKSPGPASPVVFGRAYGNPANGLIMYEGGHNIGGTGVDEIAAQRAFWNFSLLSSIEKMPVITALTMANVVRSGNVYAASVTASSPYGSPLTYQWSSSCGGTFSSPTSATTNFTAPIVTVATSCTITVTVTDACGRAVSQTKIIQVLPPYTNPDFNSTFVYVPVPGNVNTNDFVPVGTTYGTTPTLLSSPPGSLPSITMNPDGSYSFVSNLPGVYTYDVPVCVPGQAAPCPPTKLVITVLNAYLNSNFPVANVDIATTNLNTPVTLKTLANDAAGNVANILVPSTVTVTVAPLNGTTSVNPATGDITYTPNAGYTGTDTLTYQVCDNQTPAKCATARQIITIKPVGFGNLTVAADDYRITNINTAATGNVKTNDSDPEGHNQTVTTQTTTVAGKGTLVLAADGSYTFTPVANYTGPVDYPYTTCDNGVPQACAMATLHILVRPILPSTNPDFNSTFVYVPVPGNVNTNDFVPVGTTYGTTPTLLSSPPGSLPSITMNPDGSYSFVSNLPGVYTYDVPVCVPGQAAPCPPTKLVITVLNAYLNSNFPVANVDIATTNLNTPVTLKTLANDAAGNVANILVPSTVTVTVAPLNGTTSVNPATGDITYTPNAGYTGTDTLTYQVCDNQTPAKCATARQIITIKPVGFGNLTVAADDYRITNINTAATGNVKTNDSDPEGNTQTVTTQNTTVAGKGTLVLAADGSYTFTPVNNYVGPVDYPYTTCDNGVPVACAMATLHILVRPTVFIPDLTPNITTIPNIITDTMNFNVTVRIQELDNAPTNGTEILVRIIKDSRITFTYNPGLINIGFTPVQNSVWTYDGSDPFFHIFRTSIVIAANGASTFGFVANFNPGGKTRGKYTMSSSLNSGSGGETKTNNNQDAEVLDYLFR